MPRKISKDDTFDTTDDEILFTIGALKADPDARDFVSFTDGWLASVDEARAVDRAARATVAERCPRSSR